MFSIRQARAYSCIFLHIPLLPSIFQVSKHVLQNIPGEPDLEPLKPLEVEELEKIDSKALEYEIAVLEEALKQKQPNMAVIKEYLIKVS